MGLLMNHLGVDGKGRVVFDAGDAMIGDEDEELAEADEELVDLSRLRGGLLASTAVLWVGDLQRSCLLRRQWHCSTSPTHSRLFGSLPIPALCLIYLLSSA